MSTVDSHVEKRIFVVGVPRSGTTLVQSLLAAHGQVTSFTESHLFSRHFARLPLLGTPVLTRDPGPRLRAFLAENGEEPTHAAGWFEAESRRGLRSPLRALLTRRVARRLLDVLDELTLRRGRVVWLEKTPRHLRYAAFLQALSGPGQETHVVHVIRDGLETVASLHAASRSWERAYDLRACVRRWNADVAFSLRRVGAPHDHFVFYEDLTARPEDALRPLVAGLGLDWQPGVLEGYAEAAGRLVTGEESWKKGVERGIARSGTSGRVLTREQRDEVARGLDGSLYARLRERAGQRGPA